MKQGLTEIVAILDKSGSMMPVAGDSIGGINSFITEQASLPGDASFTLTLFDTNITKKYDGVPIKNVKPLEKNDYIPGGNTSLLDAIGVTINEVGARLASLPETDRPEKVIFAILTDGEENSSREYSRSQIFDMINHQREKYNWEFMFLAANQDAISTGQQMGILHSANYVSDSNGTQDAYMSISRSVKAYRSSGKVDLDND